VLDGLDYTMILVLAASWLRFFIYFLVVRVISKLLLTLIEMIEDTISFIFIVSCYLIIMSSIFTTVYQDTNGLKYGSLTRTIRTLFDACLAVYSYADMGNRELSHSILIITHVFFANVLLLNYLIAILSTTYDNMKQSGVFKYKKNLYQYCERFVLAFENEAYGEFVFHPPPLNYLCLFILPFIFNQEQLMKVTKIFSFLMFWLENAVCVGILLIYELCLLPFAYLKTCYNILFLESQSVLIRLAFLIGWFIVGPALCGFLAL